MVVGPQQREGAFTVEDAQRVRDRIVEFEQLTKSFNLQQKLRRGGVGGVGGVPVLLCKSIADIVPNTKTTVELWEQGEPPTDTGDDLEDVFFYWITEGQNISGNGGTRGAGKELLVTIIDGEYTIIGAECEDEAGNVTNP